MSVRAPLETLATPESDRRTWEDRLAGPMFFLALLFLIVLAGLIHRYPQPNRTELEAWLIEAALASLWVIFVLEAGFRVALRDRSRPAWRPLGSALACVLLPPLRIGCRSALRPDHVWMPALGWQPTNARLRRTLEQVFSVPMIIVALMVVPLLAFEHFAAERIHADPSLDLALAIGTSVIWLAFAVELFVMLAVADRPWNYCLRHWIDVAIVVLPAIEMMPLFRLLRLGRVLRLEQLLRWGRLHRLQALIMRGWRAVLLLQIVSRVTGRSLERQRKRLLELVQAKEEEIADLCLEIDELEKRMECEKAKLPARITPEV
jgi:voltage-gated potassium channel